MTEKDSYAKEQSSEKVLNSKNDLKGSLNLK